MSTSNMQLLADPQFLVAAHEVEQWPPDSGLEVAFAGRSNVGKSSAINTMFGRKKLARTSKTPGRTQQIVFFDLDNDRRVVDLPGYGFAKVPAPLRQHWQRTIEHYLCRRHALRGLVLLMDIRHPLTALDEQLLHWCAQGAMPAHVMLTKADKLSRGRGASVEQQVGKRLASFAIESSLQRFSALDRTGVDQAREQLLDWLQ